MGHPCSKGGSYEYVLDTGLGKRYAALFTLILMYSEKKLEKQQLDRMAKCNF